MVANATQLSRHWGVRTQTSAPPIEERILDFAGLGSALFQEQVNRIIQMCHKRMVGAVSLLQRVPWTGDAYHINRQTPVDSARWVDDTDNILGDDLTGADEQDYAKVSFPVKFLLVIARITRHAQVRGRGYADLLALETAGAVEAITYQLELTTFQGDETANPNEFDGFFKLVEPYNGSGTITQTILPANGVLATGPAISTPGDLTLEMMDQLLDELKPGSPAAIFASRAGRRVIRSLLQAQQAFNDNVRIAGGFEVETYFGAPIMPTDGIPDVLNIDDDGSGFPEFDSLTSGGSTAIIATALDQVGYAEWTPITVVQPDSGTSQSIRLDAYLDATLFLGCPQGVSAILNIKPTA